VARRGVGELRGSTALLAHSRLPSSLSRGMSRGCCRLARAGCHRCGLCGFLVVGVGLWFLLTRGVASFRETGWICCAEFPPAAVAGGVVDSVTVSRFCVVKWREGLLVGAGLCHALNHGFWRRRGRVGAWAVVVGACGPLVWPGAARSLEVCPSLERLRLSVPRGGDVGAGSVSPGAGCVRGGLEEWVSA